MDCRHSFSNIFLCCRCGAIIFFSHKYILGLFTMSHTPHLIESRAYSVLSNSLLNCHDNRVTIYSYALNLGVLILFILVTVMVLYSCYVSKKSPEEMTIKTQKEQEYIVQKIREYKHEQRMISNKSSITGLPYTNEMPL